MKKLLLIAFFSSAVIFPPVQAYCSTHFFYNHGCSECRRNEDIAGKIVLSVAAAGLTVIGAKYLIEKTPARRYASAQKTYIALNNCLSSVKGKNGDVADAATQLFSTSPYPLVAMFNHLNSLHEEAKNAVEEKLENATWWSKKEAFVHSCNQLKDQLKERVEALNIVTQLVRSNPAWTSQYALYLQQCQNDETRRIATQVMLNRLNRVR